MYLTKRQREIYEYIFDQILAKGYAPSIMEIGEKFGLSSTGTVHKHLTHLEAKGLIRRFHNRSRAIELCRDELTIGKYPFLGRIAAGRPIEFVEQSELVSILPEGHCEDVFVLRVKGDSMIEDHIQEGDYIIVERRSDARNGETVVALINNENATLKRFYREGGKIRLQPANPTMKPIFIDNEDLRIQGVVIGVLRKYK